MDKELKILIEKKLALTVLLLVVIFLLVAFLSKNYGEHLGAFTYWMSDTFGFWGLSGILFISDTFVSPFPPDLILLVVSKTDLAANWPLYVGVLGLISMVAGHVGWVLGKYLGDTKIIHAVIKRFRSKNKKIVEKFGPWAVFLGALTPVPFSVTCWSAGLLEVPYRAFATACFFRLPRFYLYYWVISQSGQF